MAIINKLVWDVWQDNAKKKADHEAIIHWDALAEPFRWTYSGLFREALNIADSLVCQGVKKGDVCAIILRHNKYFYPIYMGVSLIGAVPAVLAYPNGRLHPDKFVQGLSGMARMSGLDWVMTERELETVVKPLIINQASSVKGIFFPLDWVDGKHSQEPNYGLITAGCKTADSSEPFLLQHSSGTTGLQKAVVLSHRAVLWHLERYTKSIGLSENDKIVNWLPLYHDMGLIAAFHMPLVFGVPSIQIDPFQWVCAPAILFEVISKESGTLAWLPNFAYNLMADRIHESDMEGISLSSMRMFINCSEVVRPQSHEKFFNRFCKYGVKKKSLAACYAMAEATFAVTQTEPGSESMTVELDRDLLAKGIAQPFQEGCLKKIYMSSGKPICDCSIKIVDEHGAELPSGRVGVVLIKSVSLFDGYRNDPQKTEQVLKDGWYTSGDLGFFYKGEYFIIGRKDDVIVNAGRNIFPEDVENAVNVVPGVIAGRVVAFGLENPENGTQDVCVIAETLYESEQEKSALKLAIRQAAMDIDITINAVYLVLPRWLMKSSAGKLSRKANKERILSI